MLSAEPHTAEAAASVIGGSGLNFTCGRGNRELALRCGEDKCVTAVAGDDGVVPCAGRDRVGAVADLHLAVSKDKQILAFAEMRVSSPSPRATVLLPLPPQVDRRARRVPQRQLVRAISQLNVGGTDNKDDRTAQTPIPSSGKPSRSRVINHDFVSRMDQAELRRATSKIVSYSSRMFGCNPAI
jgi:hypothetical protein